MVGFLQIRCRWMRGHRSLTNTPTKNKLANFPLVSNPKEVPSLEQRTPFFEFTYFQNAFSAFLEFMQTQVSFLLKEK